MRYGWLDAAGAPKPVYATAHAALTSTLDCPTVARADGAPVGWPDTSTIPPADTAPACTDMVISSSAGQSASADLACTDADGDTLSYALTAPPVNGTLSQAGSVFTYVPSAGFAGDESLIVSARDGVYATPIRVTISVTAPVPAPLPATPEAQSLETAPVVAAPAVAPAIVTPVARISTAATARGPASVRNGMLSITLLCPDQTAACTGRVRLSAILKGARRSLGAHAATIGPGATARFAIAIPGPTRKLLRARAGSALPLRVAFVTTSAYSGARTATRTVSLQLPR